MVALAGASARALPSGWIHPEKGIFTIGLEMNRMTKRDMAYNRQHPAKFRADNKEYGLRVGYCFSENAEIYARAGSGDLALVDINSSVFGGSINTQREMLWGLGVQGVLSGNDILNIGGDAQYALHTGHTAVSSTGSTTEADWERWQVGLQAQGKIAKLRPYLGARYSVARVFNLTVNGTGAGDVTAEENIGGYAGAGFELMPELSVFFESRFIDETSYGGGLRYHF